MIWAMGLARAGLAVMSSDGCVTSEQVALELGTVVESETLQRMDLEVTVTDDALLVRVIDGSEILWSKVASVGPEDCPVVPVLVARTVEQALAELPRRSFGAASLPAEVALGVRAMPLPSVPPRWALVLGGSGPVSGRARWMAGAAMSTEAMRVDKDVGADVVELTARAGPAVDLGSGPGAARVGVALAGGPAWFVPIGITPDLETTVLPCVRAEATVTWVPPSPVRAALVVSVPAIRYEFHDTETGERALEAPWRLGVQFGVARVLRRQ